ncbi:MAG: RDD family protein [Pirellulales bacterium]
MTRGTEQLDTSIEIVTPENIAFRYRAAGPFRRLPAYLVDLVIRGLIGVLAMLALALLFHLIGVAGMGMGIAGVVWFILAWFYGGLFETFWNGQTPGKRMMRIRVLSVDGQPINGFQAVLRNVLRAVDAMPAVYYQLGLITATMNDRFQRLGDLAAGTMVVVEERQFGYAVARVTDPEAIRLAGQIPPDFRVSRSLGRALAGYVQRRAVFTWGRRAEIAQHLGEPLRERFGLPPGTSCDLLLSALYHRTFIAETANGQGVSDLGESPFMVREVVTS